MKEVKGYRLKKDLPDGSRVNDVYVKTNACGNFYYNKRIYDEAKVIDEGHRWETWQVERNPDWFEEIKPTESKEWIVIAIEYKGSISFWSSGRGYTLEEIQRDGYNIYSVVRLSDGITFTVKDVCDNISYAGYPSKPIKRFFIKDNVCYVQFDEGHGSNDGCLTINSIKKSARKESKDVFTWDANTAIEFAKWCQADRRIPDFNYDPSMKDFLRSKQPFLDMSAGPSFDKQTLKPDSKERIEVRDFRYTHQTPFGCPAFDFCVVGGRIAPDKFPLIKQAIENLLNK